MVAAAEGDGTAAAIARAAFYSTTEQWDSHDPWNGECLIDGIVAEKFDRLVDQVEQAAAVIGETMVA